MSRNVGSHRMRRPGEIFEELERMIVSRRGEPIDRSYTAKLLHAGANKVGGKVVEDRRGSSPERNLGPYLAGAINQPDQGCEGVGV